jgi:competence protein ComEC
MFKHRPAMKFCVPFMVGISVGWQWNISLWVSAGGMVLLVLAVLLLNRESIQRSVTLVCLLITAGLVKSTVDGKDLAPDNISNSIQTGRKVGIIARITDAPRLSARSVRFVVEAESITVNNIRRTASGGILVSLLRENVSDSMLAAIAYGNTLRMKGELTLPPRAGNPGEFDLCRYLFVNGVYAQIFPEREHIPVIRTDTSVSVFRSMVYDVRRSIAGKIDELFEVRESAFLKGLLLGERSELPQDIKLDFVNAGVMHILAVSGLHIVIVTMMLMVVLRIIRIPERARIILVICMLIYYAFLTGGSASVVRSVIMAIVFLVSKAIERKTDIYNVLAVSAIIILAYDARQLFQPGFQLSYAAVFSLVYFYPKVCSVRQIIPEKYRNWPVMVMLQAVAVTIAATIGTIPFSAYYFGKISVIGVVVNIFAVPLSNAILCLGMLATVVGYCSAWIADIYASATSFLTNCLLWSVSVVADVPYAFLRARFDPLRFVALFGVIALMSNCMKQERRKRSLIAALFGINAVMYYLIAFSPQGNRLRVTFVDVGQGDAALVSFPDGQHVLVDAGPVSANYDAGARVLLPLLRWNGIDRLDAVIVTHPHSDHLGGIRSLLRSIPVDAVVDAGSRTSSTLYDEYIRLLDSLNIPRATTHAGELLQFSNALRCYVLYPDSDDVLRNRNLNNQSVVVKMQYGETSLLFSGDAESEAEGEMVRKYGSFLRSNLLKVGHHGSKTSSTEEFLKNIQPEVGIISVGRKNKFRHPSEEVIKRFKSGQCEILRTDKEGAIIFESDGKQWKRVDWR